jgi:hypothetical protein
MCALAHFRTSVIAIATILAMLLVPACGSLCATMNHCSTTEASANSDSCHHGDMSARSDSETQSISSNTSCGGQLPVAATLASPESYFQLRSVESTVAAPSVDLTKYAVALDGYRNEFLSSKESPRNSSPFENLSVLRI